MGEFTDVRLGVCRRAGAYDLVHANFFMSALVAAELKRALGMPFVVTFHALGRVRRLHQGGADSFPDERLRDRGPGRRRGRPDHRRVPAGRGRPDPASTAPTRRGSRRSPAASTRPSSGRSTRPRRAPALGLDPRRADRPPARPDGPAQGRRQRDPRPRPACARPHGIRARLLVVGGESDDARPGGHARDRPAAGDRRRGGRRRSRSRSSAAAAATSCGTTTAPPTSSSRRPGTSRSASRRVEAMACGTPVVGVGGRRHQVHGRRRRDRLPRPAERPGRPRRPARACIATRRFWRSSVAQAIRSATCSPGNGWSATSPRSTRMSRRRPPHRTASGVDSVPRLTTTAPTCRRLKARQASSRLPARKADIR